jgi:RsiW-degrading membrane proteinase PrsW (M82 family)
MNVFVRRSEKAYGPYPLHMVQQFLASGQLVAHDLARFEGDGPNDWRRLVELMSCPAPAFRKAPEADAWTSTFDTIRALGMRLLFPWTEILAGEWMKDRRLINLAVVGLSPALALAVAPSAAAGYWLIALYFSVLWAFFYFYVFRTPQVEAVQAVLSFTFTAVVAVAGLLQLHKLSIWPDVDVWTESASWAARLFGCIVFIGIPEELCKATILFWLVRRPDRLLTPQTAVFYGMISGLGFGIYEGVLYQRHVNSRLDPSWAYFMNIARLTSLPFFHSIWTGIAGYFIGFSALYPKKRYGLWILAVGLPALAHGVYDTFGWGWVGLGTVFLSVLMLTIYLKNSGTLQRQLAGA